MWLNLNPEHSPSSQQGCTEFYSVCFCLFMEKIISTLSKSQARQNMQNLLPRYLFVSILHNKKFEFVIKQPQKHPENIWSHTQLFQSASETSSIVLQCSFVSLQTCTGLWHFIFSRKGSFKLIKMRFVISCKGKSDLGITTENCEREFWKRIYQTQWISARVCFWCTIM